MKKTWKKPVFVILFILLNIAVIAATAFSEFSNVENAAKLSDVVLNWWLIIPAVACFIVAITIDIYKYVLMISKAGKSKAKKSEIWRTARRTVLLGKYYDNITPGSIGGQPFQIYYMHKHSKLSDGMATSIPLVGMITTQMGFLIIAIAVFSFGAPFINNAPLLMTAIFGLLFYAFWPVLVFGTLFFPKKTAKVIKFIAKIGAKIKIIKNEAVVLEKIEKGVHEYTKSVKSVLKTKGLFAKTVIIAVVFQFLIMSIPWFVLTAFGGNMDFLTCFAITTAVTSAVYFVPTPGNAGAAEGTFFVVFSALSSGYVFWAMLFWRFFSYYIYIIMGPIIYFRMHLEKKRKKLPDNGV